MSHAVTPAKCGNVCALFLYQRVHGTLLRVIKHRLLQNCPGAIYVIQDAASSQLYNAMPPSTTTVDPVM